jgi:hypothetical protein
VGTWQCGRVIYSSVIEYVMVVGLAARTQDSCNVFGVAECGAEAHTSAYSACATLHFAAVLASVCVRTLKFESIQHAMHFVCTR